MGQFTLHRAILNRAGFQTEHKNRNGMDNRRSNLRLATETQNGGNKRKQHSWNGNPCSSIFKGVSQVDGRWLAQIGFDGSNHRLGLFDTEIEAAQAYNKAALEFFGEFALLNVIPDSAPEPATPAVVTVSTTTFRRRF